MDKNKTIIVSVISICLTIAFLGYLHYSHLKIRVEIGGETIKDNIKDKELEIGIYDQYTYCFNSAMKRSKENGQPCSVDKAKEICSKFNK